MIKRSRVHCLKLYLEVNKSSSKYYVSQLRNGALERVLVINQYWLFTISYLSSVSIR